MISDFRQWMQLVERSGEHSPLNSLGRPIAQTPQAIERFWQWFGNSKVINRKKQPLVVYHGTKDNFRFFDPKLSNSNTNTGVPVGTFVFTNSTDMAQSYAGQKTKDWGFATEAEQAAYHKLLIIDDDVRGASAFFKQHAIQDVKTYNEGSNVIVAYLRMVKPLRVNARGEHWHSIYYDQDEWSTNDLMALAKQKGHDGLIVMNVHDRQEGSGKAATIYAVFSASQIKSAIGNAGTFYPSNMIDEETP